MVFQHSSSRDKGVEEHSFKRPKKSMNQLVDFCKRCIELIEDYFE